MLVLVLIVIELVNMVLLIRLGKKGTFVTVENKVYYVPRKTVKKAPPVQEEYDYE